ncbi:MAG: ATP-dependent helicase RecG [Geotoga sp.]|nr:ATP-dependent helicase RecG [Geotoga sp.]
MKESQTVEFKESWRDEYLKTLCAFANTNGGTLYIGLSDDGTPVGLKSINHLLETLPNKIRNNLNIIPSVEIENINGKEIIKIEISPSEVPISYRGKFFIRAGSTTQEVSGMDLIKIVMKKQNLAWDALLSDVGVEEIDEETVLRFRKMAKERVAISLDDSIEKILKNLELIKNGKLTNAGLLLFGKDPQRYFLNSISRVGRFKTPTEILDTIEIRGNLFTQVDKLIEAIKKHLNVRFEIKGIERKDLWDYPIPAIREACINALIHRDYMNPAEIQIKIYDDHIWFWNPGRLPEGLNVEILKGEHYSKPRNKLIAMVFYYAGLIERWGTGTKRMVEFCKEQKLPEPEFKEFGDGFSVIFYKDIYNEEYLRKLGLNDRQIKAVLYVKEKGKITNKEYQEITGCSKPTATRELSNIVKAGIFLKKGITGKGTFYILGSQRAQ